MYTNKTKNLISGPEPGDYWNHSGGLYTPLVREEGPFPVQGNIGALLKQEAYDNYSSCDINSKIGGSPNCTGVFNKDIYTDVNTCGDSCFLSGPEIYGDQNFGLSNGAANVHGLHAYKNERAAADGQTAGPYGCYEFVPNLVKQDGVCKIDYSGYVATQVGDWSKLRKN